MSFWTLDRLADALGGRAAGMPRGPQPIGAVATDTRALQGGEAFVALRGERFDAHEFLGDAVRAGAAALVVERAEAARDAGVPVYVVDDALVALGRLGRYRRRAWGGPVIAVAGSNGKTSTKELIRAALGVALEVHASHGNLNNRVGLPLSLLAIPDAADIAVVELGTNVPGEVTILRAIAEPQIAVVTSIAEEHLEGLGDLEGVLREESAAFDETAVGIAPAGQPEIAEAARGRARRILTAGLDGGDLRADAHGLEPDGRGWVRVGELEIRTPLRGVHNLRNLMLALACARECGIALDAAGRGIAAMPVPPMRSAWEEHGSVTVINDAYNSNPGSARAALEMLLAAGAGRQRVAVLGTMRELGPTAPRLHDEIAALALASPLDVVAGIGDFAEALVRVGATDARVVTAPDVEQLWPALSPRLASDAMILLKASRGVRLERLTPYISAWADASCST